MERAGSTGNGGGMDYPPTEVVTSEEDELMQNASGNRSPIHPDTFIDALQNADSHDSNRLASMTASLRSKARASPNSGVSRHQSANRPIPSVAGSAGQMALPNASAARPTSIVPWVANANVGIAGPMAVPTQHHMSAPTAVSVQIRSAGASDPGGNTLYVQQVLQQIQHNPDPRLIENLAETLHRSKVEYLEQELHAQFANNARMMEDRFKTALAEARNTFQKEASHVITSLEQDTEVNEMRLREELNSAYSIQRTWRKPHLPRMRPIEIIDWPRSTQKLRHICMRCNSRVLNTKR